MSPRRLVLPVLCAVMLAAGCADAPAGTGGAPSPSTPAGQATGASPSDGPLPPGRSVPPGQSVPSGRPLPPGATGPPGPARPPSTPVVLSGVIAAGAEAGCILLRTADKQYLLVFRDP